MSIDIIRAKLQPHNGDSLYVGFTTVGTDTVLDEHTLSKY